MTADPAWRARVRTGGWLLLFPLLGWPVALGYRKAVIERLFSGASVDLPPWRGKIATYWWGGMRAVGVMTFYLSPIYALVFLRYFQTGVPNLPFGPILWLTLALIFLSPFLSPILVISSSAWVGAALFSTAETLLALGVFAAAIFVLPAGFLQVSRSGSYWAALRIDKALGLIARDPRLYVEAWLYSGLIALLGHACIPFSPWGVFWCYQSIVYAFNEVRIHTGDPEDRSAGMSESWFQQVDTHLDAYHVQPLGSFLESYVPTRPNSLREAFTALRIGPLRVPLPRVLERSLHSRRTTTPIEPEPITPEPVLPDERAA